MPSDVRFLAGTKPLYRKRYREFGNRQRGENEKRFFHFRRANRFRRISIRPSHPHRPAECLLMSASWPEQNCRTDRNGILHGVFFCHPEAKPRDLFLVLQKGCLAPLDMTERKGFLSEFILRPAEGLCMTDISPFLIRTRSSRMRSSSFRQRPRPSWSLHRIPPDPYLS